LALSERVSRKMLSASPLLKRRFARGMIPSSLSLAEWAQSLILQVS
jgi:hypothetical protein